MHSCKRFLLPSFIPWDEAIRRGYIYNLKREVKVKISGVFAMDVWKCKKCGYIYDSRVGDAKGGVPKGTPFEQVPDSWRCPRCGAAKSDFLKVETS
jgi:rubredoxin